jgi:hypothetical protein
MPEKNPWEIYSGLRGDWVVLGSEIIPLPPDRCPDQVPDWVVKNLPKEPTPYDMPVFFIDQIISMKNGRKKATIYLTSVPATRATRDVADLIEKWRPAPPPLPDEPEEPVILSRYKRPPVI